MTNHTFDFVIIFSLFVTGFVNAQNDTDNGASEAEKLKLIQSIFEGPDTPTDPKKTTPFPYVTPFPEEDPLASSEDVTEPAPVQKPCGIRNVDGLDSDRAVSSVLNLISKHERFSFAIRIYNFVLVE